MLKDNQMQTIKTYLYPNIAEVQILDPSVLTVRNRVVYSRTIKVYQGIDNPIQVMLRNQDQKKIALTDENGDPIYYVQAQIQDPINQLTVVSYDVNFTTEGYNQGIGSFSIEKAVIDDLEQRLYKLTFTLEPLATSVKQPLYIDDNFGVPLDLQVLPAYWSSIAPAPNVDQSVVDGGNL
jgi:hypothetical protein